MRENFIMMNHLNGRFFSLTGALALTAALVLTGCSSRVKTSPTTHAVKSESAPSNQSTRVAQGQTLTIQLPTKAGSVYVWRLAGESSKNRHVRLFERQEQRNKSGGLARGNDPALDVFTFKAQKTGTTTVEFIYDCVLGGNMSNCKRMTVDVEVFDPRREAASYASAESSNQSN